MGIMQEVEWSEEREDLEAHSGEWFKRAVMLERDIRELAACYTITLPSSLLADTARMSILKASPAAATFVASSASTSVMPSAVPLLLPPLGGAESSASPAATAAVESKPANRF